MLLPGLKVLQVRTMLPVPFEPTWDPEVAEAEGVRFRKRRKETADLFEEPQAAEAISIAAEVPILRQCRGPRVARMVMPLLASTHLVPQAPPQLLGEFCREMISTVPKVGMETAKTQDSGKQ